MRIGLLGGSFNPPHAAHRAISLLALKRLRLDRVWWLVTPGNPLKDNAGLPPLDARIAAARERRATIRASRSPASRPSSARATPTTRIAICAARCPGVRFVWLMGADNLAQFHRWQNWRQHRRHGADRGDRPAAG